MESHANVYSKTFDLENKRKLEKGEIPEQDLWKYSSFWYKDFDSMACKTMLRQLISKWGIMSIELQEAYEKDMSVVYEDGKIEYVDKAEQAPIIEQEVQQQPQPKMEYKQEKSVVQQEMSDDEFFAGVNA